MLRRLSAAVEHLIFQYRRRFAPLHSTLVVHRKQERRRSNPLGRRSLLSSKTASGPYMAQRGSGFGSASHSARAFSLPARPNMA